MRTGGTRVSRAHNLTQQNERWIGELVFFHDRIERNIFAVMPKLAIGHVEDNAIVNLCPVSFARKKNKLCFRVDEFFDEPWAGHAVYFNFLAGDPFHNVAGGCRTSVSDATLYVIGVSQKRPTVNLVCVGY